MYPDARYADPSERAEHHEPTGNAVYYSLTSSLKYYVSKLGLISNHFQGTEKKRPFQIII